MIATTNKRVAISERPIMKPRMIIIVRHGESEANCDRLVNQKVPNHLVQLTKDGHRMAQECGVSLAQILRPEDRIRFYISPYSRTRQTADRILEGLSAQGLEYEQFEEPRLREQDFGNFQNPTEISKVLNERAKYGSFFFRIQNGESAADVYDRCCSFASSLYRHLSNTDLDVVVLVTHGIWGRVFLMKWFGWSYNVFESLKNLPYCTPIIMNLQEDGSYQLAQGLPTWSGEHIY